MLGWVKTKELFGCGAVPCKELQYIECTETETYLPFQIYIFWIYKTGNRQCAADTDNLTAIFIKMWQWHLHLQESKKILHQLVIQMFWLLKWELPPCLQLLLRDHWTVHLVSGLRRVQLSFQAEELASEKCKSYPNAMQCLVRLSLCWKGLQLSIWPIDI